MKSGLWWCHIALALTDCVLMLHFSYQVVHGIGWILILAGSFRKAGRSVDMKAQRTECCSPLVAMHLVDQASMRLVGRFPTWLYLGPCRPPWKDKERCGTDSIGKGWDCTQLSCSVSKVDLELRELADRSSNQNVPQVQQASSKRESYGLDDKSQGPV